MPGIQLFMADILDSAYNDIKTCKKSKKHAKFYNFLAGQDDDGDYGD